jgi:hypothetical protein
VGPQKGLELRVRIPARYYPIRGGTQSQHRVKISFRVVELARSRDHKMTHPCSTLPQALGVSCMSPTIEYFSVLVIFTVFPLVVILMLFTPCLCIMVMGMIKFGGFKLHPKYGQVVNNFFQMMLLFLFIIYPTVSVTVLKTFNCDTALERLFVDYRVTCPWMSSGGIFWYVIVTHTHTHTHTHTWLSSILIQTKRAVPEGFSQTPLNSAVGSNTPPVAQSQDPKLTS